MMISGKDDGAAPQELVPTDGRDGQTGSFVGTVSTVVLAPVHWNHSKNERVILRVQI